MSFLPYTIHEAASSIRREKRRLFPMALGIVWGMASIMVLLGISNGFEASQRQTLSAYGEKFIILRLNRAELDRSAGGKERRLTMDAHDLERLREGAPAIRHLSPVNMAYRARMIGRSGAGSNVYISGVTPEINLMRNLPLEEGRFLDEFDEAERRRVIVLGPVVRKQLFGRGPAVGRTVRISGFSTSMIRGREPPRTPEVAARRGPPPPAGPAAPSRSSAGSPASSSSSSRTSSSGSSSGSGSGSSSSSSTRPSSSTGAILGDLSIQGEIFTVIGVLKDVEVQRESYASTARGAFVPFSTSCAVYDKDYSTMQIEPRTPEDRDLALRQFREVMGARYGFAPDDRNAVVLYFDAIERARSITAVFLGVRVFLAAVGLMILLVGAIGVMNVVLVSVAARTFEIGLRKALGATPLLIYLQFFCETVLVCFVSGALGFLLGSLAIALLSAIPLPQGFERPVLDARAAAMAFGLLAVVAVMVGVYPARRAAQLTPVEALRSRG